MKFSTKKLFPIALVIVLALVLVASSNEVAHAQNAAFGTGLAAASAVNANPAAGTANTSGQTPTQPASNSGCSIFGQDPCTAVVNFVLYFVSQAMGLLIAIGAWLITIGLNLTTGVYSSQATQNGFGVTLAIANLVFVLAIIVIAIATILQSESYGYKKALWRLVAMAVLVNFGLVITAPIIGFANSMTTYFVTAISGGVSGTNAIVTFSNRLASSVSVSGLVGTVPTTASAGVSIGGAFIQTLMSISFTIMFEGLIAVTFILLGLLLFVRYVYLVVLLIMLPLAWVTWVFPNFSHQFSAWWKKFIHWAFFPPVALFFVWLAVSIQVGFANAVNSGNSPASAIGLATGLSGAGGTSSSGILAQLVNSMVVIGVMIGGLMAASKLADGAGEWAVKQGKAVSGYATRRAGQLGKRAATAPLRTKPVRNAAARLQRPLTGTAEKWVNRFGLGIPDWTARKIGQGLEAGAVAGGSKTVDAAAERFKGLTGDQKINRLSGVEIENAAPQRMALLKQILDEKNIGKLSMEEMERYFGEKQKDSFAAFGQEKLYKDLREKSGLALRDLDKEIAALEASPKPLTKKDTERLADAPREKKNLIATYLRENPDGAVESFTNPDKLAKKREEAAKTGRVPASITPESIEFMQRSIAEGIASGLSTQVVSNLMKNLAEKNNLDGFESAINTMKASTDPAIMALVAKMKADYSANAPLKKWNSQNFGRRGLGVDLDKVYS